MNWDSEIKAAKARVEEAMEEIRRSGVDEKHFEKRVKST